MSELPSLPDDIQALLHKAQAGAPPPPPGAELAVLAKVTASVAPVAASAGAASTLAGLGLAKPLAALLVVVAAGATIVVVTTPTTHPRPEPTPVVAPAPPVEPARPPVEPSPPVVDAAPKTTPTPMTTTTPTTPTTPTTTTPPPAPAPPRPRAVPADAPSEGALLEDARNALARGDAELALARLKVHADTYGSGAHLVEERRALTVVAFAQRGDKERAAAAARAFVKEYPTSLFLEMVKGALGDGTIP